MSPGQMGRTPGGVPPKFFVFIGFSFPNHKATQWRPLVTRQASGGNTLGVTVVVYFGDEFGESLGGSQAPLSVWEVPGLPRKFPGSFSATSPEVLLLWNLTAIQRFPGSFPNFPGSFRDFPGSSRTSPEVSPFLWEA